MAHISQKPCALLCFVLLLVNVGCSTPATAWREVHTTAADSQGTDEVSVGMVVEVALAGGKQIVGRVHAVSTNAIKIDKQWVDRGDIVTLRYRNGSEFDQERTVAAVVLVTVILAFGLFLIVGSIAGAGNT